MPLTQIQSRFAQLVETARSCRICPDLADKAAVLSDLNGSLAPKVMFIGEAPGRVGADRTRRPFYGDKSGDNLQKLLDSIGLSRDDLFITSAVLCSPRSPTDANRKPTRAEIKNCLAHLRTTIDLIDPPVIATLGSVMRSPCVKTAEPSFSGMAVRSCRSIIRVHK